MADQQTEITAGKETFPNAKIKKIVDPLILGEGPHWDNENKLLFFVDIIGMAVHRYNPATKEHKKLEFKDTVSLIIPVKNEKNEFVISLGRQLARLSWEGRAYHTLKHLTTIIGKDGPDICTRLNDGKADHLGNIWLGTMGKESKTGEIKEKQGEFYRYSTDGTLETVAVCVGISNGIGWNNKRDRMYFIDSPTRRVDVFDYDAETGKASNRRPFFDFAANKLAGVPDGMTTDCEDNLWIACWGASRVIRVSGRTGIILGMLTFPAERITSCIFGGEKMDTLFVTSMKYGLSVEQMKEQPLAGAVFSVEGLGVCGCLSHSAIVPPGEDINKCDDKKDTGTEERKQAKDEENETENKVKKECEEKKDAVPEEKKQAKEGKN